MKTNKLYVGHVLDVLRKFPAKSVNCAVMSPPYWGLRDYTDEELEKMKEEGIDIGDEHPIWDGDPDCAHQWTEYVQNGVHGGTASKKVHVKGKVNFQDHPDVTYSYCKKCGAWNGALGKEPHYSMFIQHLCDVMDEIWRILEPDGTLFVNLGDTYWGGGNAQGHTIDTKNMGKFTLQRGYVTKPIARGKGYKDKCMVLIPFRFAIAMVERGWIIRNDNIWHKPNGMPHPVKDRSTTNHEYFFFFVKQRKYYYKQQLERFKHPKAKGMKFGGNKAKGYKNPTYSGNVYDAEKLYGKNKRSVCTYNTSNFKGAHFATYPQKLIRPFIDAGCPLYICKKCGQKAVYEYYKLEEDDEEWKKKCGADSEGGYKGKAVKNYDKVNVQNASDVKRRILKGMKKKKGRWIKCDCNAGFRSGVVLDPFMGSGTTAVEALRQGKSFIGVEYNNSYARIAAERIYPHMKQNRLNLAKLGGLSEN